MKMRNSSFKKYCIDGWRDSINKIEDSFSRLREWRNGNNEKERRVLYSNRENSRFNQQMILFNRNRMKCNVLLDNRNMKRWK